MNMFVMVVSNIHTQTNGKKKKLVNNHMYMVHVFPCTVRSFHTHTLHIVSRKKEIQGDGGRVRVGPLPYAGSVLGDIQVPCLGRPVQT